MERHSSFTLKGQTRQRPVGFGQQEFQNGSFAGTHDERLGDMLKFYYREAARCGNEYWHRTRS